MQMPTYLRVITTTRCPMACPYCHMEGDPQRAGGPTELPRDVLVACLTAALRAGVRKVKLLGGEPLVRPDLPEIVAAIRAESPTADLSIITSGVGTEATLRRLLDAGLSRANVSIHGWQMARFRHSGGTPRKLARRARLIEALIAHGRPLKLNYVYRGTEDDADLAALLDWAAPRPLTVSVLDDLGDEHAGPRGIIEAVSRLRGAGWTARPEPDPDSLETTRLSWPDGLVVEVKTAHLGALAPWRACATCPAKGRCREGIFAIRLTHDGRLQPCMDRPDISWPLAAWVSEDIDGAAARLRATLKEALA